MTILIVAGGTGGHIFPALTVAKEFSKRDLNIAWLGRDNSLEKEVRDSLDTLKQREKDVISMYFGIDRDYALTLNEIGEEFGLTRERVRQIKEKAIRRLRHRSRSRKLRQYLG